MNGRGAGVIYQCATCRSLVAARAVVLDAAHDRAGLVCDVCGAGSWLPLAGTEGARVVDVEAGRATAPSAPPLELAAAPAGLAPIASTALVPAAPTAVATSFTDEQRAKIAQKLDALGPVTEVTQQDLAHTFERLVGTAWSNEAEHKQLLKRAATVGQLAFVGQRYRLILDVVPNDAQAKRSQNDILGLAMATMSNARDLGSTEEGTTSTRTKVLVAALTFLVVFLGILVILAPRLLRVFGSEDMIDAPPVLAPVGEGGTPQP